MAPRMVTIKHKRMEAVLAKAKVYRDADLSDAPQNPTSHRRCTAYVRCLLFFNTDLQDWGPSLRKQVGRRFLTFGVTHKNLCESGHLLLRDPHSLEENEFSTASCWP